VYDYGEATLAGAQVPYLVMELVEGDSLATVLGRGALSWPTAVGIGAQVAAALATAHAHGVVHCDITPSNVMLSADGVKVIDFGVCASAGDQAGTQVYGTPAYLAPERRAGGSAVAGTDVYGLGLLLYEMLAGKLPWPDGSTTELLVAHREVPPAPLPRVAGLPAGMAELVADCLALDPAKRPSASRLCVALSAAARAGDQGNHPAPGGNGSDGKGPGGKTSGRLSGGTRILPHGVTSLPDPLRVTEPIRRIARRPLFMLPSILLAILIACLGLSQIGPGRFASPSPKPTGTPPVAGAIPPIGGAPRGSAAPPRALACHVKYRVTSDWIFGFTAQVTIANVGKRDIAGWELTFHLGDGQRVGGGWNANFAQDGDLVTISNAGDNAQVRAGTNVTVGFLGTTTGDTTPPTKFVLNGTRCTPG
jgi:eukaryotic-like serine/threonine-protein kinase